jgi:protoporphyrinogen oxidase
MERKLAISFNPSYDELTNTEQQSNYPIYNEDHDENMQKYQQDQQNQKE